MDISRRKFLRVSAAGSFALSTLGFDLRPAYAAVRQLKIRNICVSRHSARDDRWEGYPRLGDRASPGVAARQTPDART